jgi:integrase
MSRIRRGYLIKRGRTFSACFYVAGKKFVQATGKSVRREAEAELARIMEPFHVENEIKTLETVKARIEGAKTELATMANARTPPLAVSTAWTVYAKHPDRPDSGPRTLANYEGHYDQFRQWMEKAHPTIAALRDVSAEVAGDYARHLTERGLSPNSYNKHLNLLALLFKTLATAAKVTANPWLIIRRKRLAPASRRELTIDELTRVCQSAQGEMRLLFALGIYTGLRLGDCATLQWGEVDLTRTVIRRVPNKTARHNPRPVVVPIHYALAPMLAETPPEERTGYVLPITAAKYRKDAPVLSLAIQAHFAANGIRTVKVDTGAGTDARAVVEVGFHSLRHTFVSMCRAADAPLSVVEAIVGHSSPAMTQHYTHTSEAAATLAVAALPSVMGGKARLALPERPTEAALRAMLRPVVDKLTGRNWRTVKAEMLALIE